MDCFKSTDISIYPFQQALAAVSIRADQRTVIEERYVRLLQESYRRCCQITVIFNLNRTIITIGSIIVPALLSIQYTNIGTLSPYTFPIYWITWAISLLVTISNGLLAMFKLDKKYYLLHASYEQLKSEGWQYLALTGNYRNSHTHDSAFPRFSYTIEKIRMYQMQEEYIKIQEMDTTGHGHGAPSTGIPALLDMAKTPVKDDIIQEITKIVKEQLKKDTTLE